MPLRSRIGLILSLVFAVFSIPILIAVEPSDSANEAAAPTQHDLRVELLARMKKEQEARDQLVGWAKEHQIAFGSNEFLEKAKPLLKELERVDAQNRTWLANVVDQHGWPGRTMVGKDGAKAAFLLVQHAHRDLGLQKRCLALIRRATEGDVEPVDIAYLEDRVRLAEGRKQLYGTQVEFKDGRWRTREVANPEHLDQRRKAIGLPPIANYLRTVEQMYGKVSEDRTP